MYCTSKRGKWARAFPDANQKGNLDIVLQPLNPLPRPAARKLEAITTCLDLVPAGGSYVPAPGTT